LNASTALLATQSTAPSPAARWSFPSVTSEDVRHAFARGPRDAVHNATFNVGQTSENYRISELADVVAGTVPGCRIEYAPGGAPDKRCYRVTCDRIARVLPNFRPEWTARKGAQELYDAYRSAGLTSDDVNSGRYFRINRIQGLQKVGRLDGSLQWMGAGSADVVTTPAAVG